MGKNLLVTTPRNLGVTITFVQSLVNIKWFDFLVTGGECVDLCHEGL